MKAARFLIFLLSMALTTRAWAGGEAPLVYVYCDYLTSNSPSVEIDENSWRDLVRRFEKRELVSQRSTLSESPKFQECIRKYSTFFETGEFIFEGRSQLQGSLGVLKENPSEKVRLTGNEAVPEDRLIVNEYGSVLVSRGEGEWRPSSMEREMRDREGRYTALWNGFLDSVHKNLKDSNPSKPQE